MSQEIVRQAHSEAEGIRAGADDYAADVLSKLEVEVMRTLKSIRLGLDCSTTGAPFPRSLEDTDGEGALDEYEESEGEEEPIRG